MTLADDDRLRWQCRRGLLELDVLLQDFLDQGLASLQEADSWWFQCLLREPDPQLLAWILGTEEPYREEYRPLLEAIRRSAYRRTQSG